MSKLPREQRVLEARVEVNNVLTQFNNVRSAAELVQSMIQNPTQLGRANAFGTLWTALRNLNNAVTNTVTGPNALLTLNQFGIVAEQVSTGIAAAVDPNDATITGWDAVEASFIAAHAAAENLFASINSQAGLAAFLTPSGWNNNGGLIFARSIGTAARDQLLGELVAYISEFEGA